MYFEYDETTVENLKKKDAVLGAAMDEIGHVYREVTPDLFCALVMQIISQQISTKGAATICNRMRDALGQVTPEAVERTDINDIQKFGMSMRKATYIKELAKTVQDGTLDLDSLHEMQDDDLCVHLSQIKGIGVWTAEMLMTFSMQRPDIMSWDDIAIHRGLRMLYRHRKITRKLFDKYKRRYSPNASVACLYLWAIAGGACPELTDPAPMTPAQKKTKQQRARLAKKQKQQMGKI